MVYLTLHPHQRPLATTVALWAKRLAFLALGSVAFAAVAVTAVVAQATRPASAEAAHLRQTRPELVAQLRDRLPTSGLTPEQVRARLKAEGYPENLLDAYMGGANTGAADAPSARVCSAVRALAIRNARDLEELKAVYGDRARRVPVRIAVVTVTNKNTTLSAVSAELFGLALFRESTTLFSAHLDGPIDAEYRVGPGDELVLILTGEAEAAYTLEATRSGFVVIPQVGQVSVANLTLGELESLLCTRLGCVYGGIRRSDGGATKFSINVSKLRSNQVFVLGDVVTPNSYRISSAGTALGALYAVGGASERRSLLQVQVSRSGKTANLVSAPPAFRAAARG